MDLPEPAGPHMKTTLDMGVMLARDAGSTPAAAVDRRLCERAGRIQTRATERLGIFDERTYGWM